jgi:hypothetical protein
MKPSKKIIILSTIVAAIVLFWLVPGINKAKYKRYTRMYEDTEVVPKTFAAARDTFTLYLPAPPPPAKVYKKETIDSEASLKDINPEMFSRAIHFHEEIPLIEEPVVALDSIYQLELRDSAQYVLADTASVNR